MMWNRSKSLKDIKYRSELNKLSSDTNKLTSKTNKLDVTTDDLQDAAVEVAAITADNSTQIATTNALIEDIQEALVEIGSIIGEIGGE